MNAFFLFKYENEIQIQSSENKSFGKNNRQNISKYFKPYLTH